MALTIATCLKRLLHGSVSSIGFKKLWLAPLNRIAQYANPRSFERTFLAEEQNIPLIVA